MIGLALNFGRCLSTQMMSVALDLALRVRCLALALDLRLEYLYFEGHVLGLGLDLVTLILVNNTVHNSSSKRRIPTVTNDEKSYEGRQK